MTHQEREKLVFQHINEGDWRRAIEHTKHMPAPWDVFQRFPTAHPEGMPNSAINDVLDHLENRGLDRSGFLFEMAHNLMGHHDTPTVKRLARLAHKSGSYLEARKFTEHPAYQLDPDEKNTALANQFWLQYERKVHPHQFAIIEALHTGNPSTITHRGLTGSSDAGINVMPHLRDYAKKIQGKVLEDKDIRKRYYNNEPYIKVYRGIGGQYSKMLRDAAHYNSKTGEHESKNLIVPSAPFSSWSLDKEMASRFAKGRGGDLNLPGHGLVLSKWMPVKDILHSGIERHEALPHFAGIHPEEQEIVFGHPTGKIKISTNEMHFETPNGDFALGVKKDKLAKGIKEHAINFATAVSMLGLPANLQHAYTEVNQPVSAQPRMPSAVQPLPGLKYIEMIESSGGKHLKHEMVHHGLNRGTRAIGRYGLMPLQVIDTISHDKDLQQKYPKLLRYDPKKDANRMAKDIVSNPNLENEIANSHWKRLNNKFDGDENKMAHAWYNGITRTIQSDPNDIQQHDYVKKYNRYKKLMQLEHSIKKEPIKKSEAALPSDLSHIQKFEATNEKPEDVKNVQLINELIGMKAFHTVPSPGKFTHSSFVVGTNHSNAWLMKIEPGNRPSIISAKTGLQPVKEAAFYDVAKDVFGLGDVIPDAILGNLITDKEAKPVAAIKMLPVQYKLAQEIEKKRPGTMFSVLEKYRKSGMLHKMGAMMYILGEGDGHGRNCMSDEFFIKLIDHGSSFGDEKFDPAKDPSIFIPYIMRVGRLKKDEPPAEKLKKLPRIDNLRVKENLKVWLLSLNYHNLEQKLNMYGIDPKPIIDRLKKLQSMISSGMEPDEAVNKVWVE